MSLIHVSDVQAFPIARGYFIKLYFLGDVIALACFKIHTKPSLIAILLLLPLILFAMRGRGLSAAVVAPLTRSIGVWVALAVTVAFYEMLSYIVGDVTNRPYHYPTISMLVDPMLHNVGGRIFFVACWTLIGYKFIFQKQVH